MLMVPQEPVSIFSDRYTHFGKKKKKIKSKLIGKAKMDYKTLK